MSPRVALLILVLVLSWGCSSPAKPTPEEVKVARSGNPLARSVDKSRDVASEASARTDDPALH